MPNVWSLKALTLNSQKEINSLAVFNGKIYGGTGGGGRLFEWNGVNAWSQVAPSLGTTDIYCLAVYGGSLYGGADSGKLVKWNGVNAWQLVDDIGAPSIEAFTQMGGYLYFSTYQNSAIGGRLYRSTGTGVSTMVADQLNGQTGVYSLINYNNNIYGGTSPNGRLFRWNGVNTWVEVAAQHEAEPRIRCLGEYEGKIFAGTSGSGNKGFLFEWNGVDAWITRANTLNAQVIRSGVLVTHHENKILAGTESLANLYMWNGVDAWLQVAPQPATQISIFSLIEFEGEVYGGTYKNTSLGGRLYKWESSYPGSATELLCCDKASSVGPGGECVPAIIDTIVPYFSAIYNDPDAGDIADHYRIQVNTAYDLTGTEMWDSGKTSMSNVVEGNRCEDLYYSGSVLSIDVTYYWRIMFWDDEGNIGDWSAVNCFRIETVLPDVKPPKYRLTIGDNILMCEADKQDLFEMHFTLRQNGGCCEFNLSLKAPEFVVNLGDQVSIYLFGSTTPWYVGRVLERDRPGSSSRVRKYSGYGHFELLNGCDLVNRNYGNVPGNEQSIRTIVIHLLDNYVRNVLLTPLITGVNTYIQDVAGYVVQDLNFDRVKPIAALTELCELAQNYEFGVTENGDFYFRLISTNITERKWVGKHLASYSPKEDMRKVINYYYLEGGALVAGSNYDSFIQDAASILKWGQRSGKATVPDGFDTAEIARWGADLLDKTKDPIVKAAITGIDIEQTQTRIWPRGQMRITSEDGADVLDFPMKTVTYHITPAGITADVELGEKIVSLRDSVGAIEKQLHEEREQLAHDVQQLASGTGLMSNSVNDTHIDWGFGANQVSAVDVPIADGGGLYVATEVETALQEVMGAAEPTLKTLIYLSFFKEEL